MSKNHKNQKSKLSYEDISDIVEYLVNTKAYQNTFDCYTQEDVAQEIRLICLKALEHFEWSKVNKNKLVNFFGRCVDNGLKNLKRDKYIRYSPPCNSDCSYLHGDEYINKGLGKVCKRWIKFRKTLQKKINIRHPISVDYVSEPLKVASFEKEVETEDFKNYLISKMDDELKPYLISILQGDRRDVPAKYRHKIQRFIKKIIKE